MTNLKPVFLITAAVLLGGCDMLGIQGGAAKLAAQESEGKAIGGACRHAGRAIEDCYAFNPTASKAAVFAGWKAMNDYMAENKLEVVRPQIEPKLPGSKRKEAASDKADKAADRSGDKVGAEKSAGKESDGAAPGGTPKLVDLSIDKARLSSR